VNLKTVTVREAAEALGLTKRAVMYRLETSKLKGTRVKNSYGVEEWRIYPTKEISERLNDPARVKAAAQAEEVAEEFFDAEDISYTEPGVTETPEDSYEEERRKMRMMAEEFVRPLLESLDAKNKELIRKEQEVEHLKVKLLPDLQKQAETERKASELKELEVTALKKQIDDIKNSNEAELTAAKEQIELLQKQLSEPEKKESWFKKWFGLTES
jgi:hypothetical protein